jgi:hypothetical protein
MKRSRKQLSGPEKLALLKRYLVEKIPISDLCDQHGLQPAGPQATTWYCPSD